jgi:hypothetical protein
METYNQFVAAFHNEVQRNKKLNGFSDLHCRNNWGFDAGRVISKKNKPYTKTFFQYCSATGQCPVQLLITLIKPHINLRQLLIYIQNELKTGE